MKEFANCAYCGDTVELPFECNYCKDPFCAEHRLPEDHRCVKLTLLRAKKFGEKKVIRDKGVGRQSFFKKLFGKFKD
ncbi:MAG: AN1-type zinc finger domain-containing protein [Nitrosopumilaceae archaeon]